MLADLRSPTGDAKPLELRFAGAALSVASSPQAPGLLHHPSQPHTIPVVGSHAQAYLEGGNTAPVYISLAVALLEVKDLVLLA